MEESYPENVFIFGAGVSVDAGIPVLGNFIDAMSELILKKKFNSSKDIKPAILDILTKANQIRQELDSYSARVKFDNHNIEDILSILSFNQMGRRSRIKYERLVQAIATTIKLKSKISRYKENHINASDIKNKFQSLHNNVYTKFWKSYFSIAEKSPAIITFNYDLVLETSLWNSFFSLQETGCNCASIKYSDDHAINIYQKKDHKIFDSGFRNGLREEYCYYPAITTSPNNKNLEIEYLKLHGSLNWKSKNKKLSLPNNPFATATSPMILPPVFNKAYTTEMQHIWSRARNILVNAKRIIVVGYSLPKTDIYMQYFLKSAIGPNKYDPEIIVFDPTLFDPAKVAQSKQMIERYSECFSEAQQKYINFNPEFVGVYNEQKGTFSHFVDSLSKNPKTLLF